MIRMAEPAPCTYGGKPPGLGRVAAILPARDEAMALPAVLLAMPQWLDRIIVVDNGSRDDTARIARAHGAEVVSEPEAGYGAACLAGIAVAEDCDVLLFLDADGSDRPQDASLVLGPIAAGVADLVIGSRVKGGAEPGALTLPQLFGNRLATFLMRMLWRAEVTDLGPFRAVTRNALERIGMRDRDYGWTVEMQARALRLGLRVTEVAVARHHRKAGKSKVSGTVTGVVRAGTKILYVIGREALTRARR